MPIVPTPVSLSASTTQTSVFLGVKQQWQNPSDIFTILMIIGGDIVQIALTQLVSSKFVTPVAFSFGWVSYSISTITAVIGSKRLAPQPDCSCLLLEATTGYSRNVNSWVLARLVRDYEHPKAINCERGLTVAFFDSIGNGEAPNKRKTGVPNCDWRYFTGIFVILLQLGISVIPGVLRGNWVILIVLCGGTILTQLQATLPHWRKELWNARVIGAGRKGTEGNTARNNQGRVYCLTRGNGSMDVIVIRSPVGDLNLADIAGARGVHSRTTIPATFILAVLWLALLFTTQGMDEDTWYLVGIGAIGMLQNVIVAGARCDAGALGFHLRKSQLPAEDEIDKVFRALQLAEKVERRVGIDLLGVFFPGGLKPAEVKWRDETLKSYEKDQKK
ncbi:hypothetical protein L218DRAFT_921752 [Marasmius fiardii PR-910]|nr:hypothetical protein L218DRAFT_921752 [Marasmius fiardii PR-910]